MSHQAGRELDALIAEKVFGLIQRRIVPEWLGREVWLFSHPAYPDEVMYSWDEPSGNAMMYQDGKTAESGTAQVLPPYSDDIAAVWEVVEKMRPHALHLFAPGALVNDEFGEYTASWMAQFIMWSKPNGGDDAMLPGNWYGSPAFAETAPLAICLAALNAVGASGVVERSPTP